MLGQYERIKNKVVALHARSWSRHHFIGGGQAVQHAGLMHERLGDGVSARDGGQLGVENAGKGEQVVTLVLQRDAHRADASRVLGLTGHQLRDDEVEQLSLCGQVWTGQGENVMAQPLDERSDVTGEA
jgi:hypothetical protein